MLDAGIGLPWFGVHTQMSVTDSATIHQLLWRVQPDLLIEIGTMCGGSAIFYARTMQSYNPRARVLTYDTNSNVAYRLKRCRAFHRHSEHDTRHNRTAFGLEHPSWSQLQASGNLQPIIGSALDSTLHEKLVEEARKASAVVVVDDGAHVKDVNVRHWHALSPLVTMDSYYIVQDTRLDSDCAYATLIGKGSWCKEVRLKGGPALAVAAIVGNASFRDEWMQDRSVEEWGVTQHPGGYLRRTQVRSAPT